MSNYRPQPGTTLRGDDGTALVVEPGTTPLTALLDLLESEYGGERFAESNPVVVAAVQNVKIEDWRSCTKAWIEAEGVDGEWDTGWWAPHGDGARVITVAHFDGSVYDVGDRASDAEPAAAPADSVGEKP